MFLTCLTCALWINTMLLSPSAFHLQAIVMKADRNIVSALERSHRQSNLGMSTSEISDGVAQETDLSITEASEEAPAALPRLSWHAAVKSSVRVTENGRTCEEYMRLPASEYSVLSAEQITRISESEFRCTLPVMNFFGTKIQPVLYVDVHIFPEFNRSEIVVLRAETVGSEMALRVNGTFSLNAINVVSAGVDHKGRKTLSSDTRVVVNVEVPPSSFPLRVIQTGGNFIIQASLDIIVPTFVRVLSADFHRWSAGNDTRGAVEDATFSTS